MRKTTLTLILSSAALFFATYSWLGVQSGGLSEISDDGVNSALKPPLTTHKLATDAITQPPAPEQIQTSASKHEKPEAPVTLNDKQKHVAELFNALKTPGLSEKILASKARKEDPDYLAFLQAIGASSATQKNILKLLAKKRKWEMDYLASFLPEEFGTAEGKKKGELNKLGLTDLDLEIEKELGSQSNATRYKRWESTRGQRNQIVELEILTGKTFQPSQVETIVDALKSQSLAFGSLLKDNKDAYLHQKTSDALNAKLNSILNPEEIETLIRFSTTRKLSPPNKQATSQAAP